LFFAADGAANFVEGLEVNQADYVVLSCETWDLLLFVLGDAAFQVVGYSGVEDAAGVGEDVNVVDHGAGLWHVAWRVVIPTRGRGKVLETGRVDYAG